MDLDRQVGHSLRVKGIHVPRYLVQNLLKEIDPEGTYITKLNYFTTD